MKTESQHKRYRDGYAAGQRDGSASSSNEDELIMRSVTGDRDADTGYTDGFAQGRRQFRMGAFSGLSRVVRDIFWIPQVSKWFKRSASAD